jgi:hypothetical protein
MQRQLGLAKRQLSDERSAVKEEPRWEPDASQEDSDEEAPRKRARHDKQSTREQPTEEDEAKELRALQRRLEAHYSSMKNFIRTQAEPTIFYLPAKHNSETRKQLEETRAAISSKIASLKVHLQSTGPGNEDESEDGSE